MDFLPIENMGNGCTMHIRNRMSREVVEIAMGKWNEPDSSWKGHLLQSRAGEILCSLQQLHNPEKEKALTALEF